MATTQPTAPTSKKGLIIGLSVGGVVLAAGIVLVILFLTVWRPQPSQEQAAEQAAPSQQPRQAAWLINDDDEPPLEEATSSGNDTITREEYLAAHRQNSAAGQAWLAMQKAVIALGNQAYEGQPDPATSQQLGQLITKYKQAVATLKGMKAMTDDEVRQDYNQLVKASNLNIRKTRWHRAIMTSQQLADIRQHCDMTRIIEGAGDDPATMYEQSKRAVVPCLEALDRLRQATPDEWHEPIERMQDSYARRAELFRSAHNMTADQAKQTKAEYLGRAVQQQEQQRTLFFTKLKLIRNQGLSAAQAVDQLSRPLTKRVNNYDQYKR